jgi:hypothetical protein
MKLCQATEWLFFHLWKENNSTQSSCPGILIPDTIIYRWAKPHFYYYTGKDGRLIRNTKERIDNILIDDNFTKRVPKKSGLVGCYLKSEAESQFKYEKNQSTQQIEKIQVI